MRGGMTDARTPCAKRVDFLERILEGALCGAELHELKVVQVLHTHMQVTHTHASITHTHPSITHTHASITHTHPREKSEQVQVRRSVLTFQRFSIRYICCHRQFIATKSGLLV